MIKTNGAGIACSKIWMLLFLFNIAFVAAYAQKQKHEKHKQTLPLDPNVRTGVLPNGFTYYIRKNALPKGRLHLYLANKVGSIQEDDDQLGLAHFMEHMNFNGTVHYPKNELVNYLQKIGVRFGADLNASTDYDATIYQLPIPSDRPDLIKNGLLIMHDWAQGATLDSEEINSERGVILEEKRLRNSAGLRMENQYLPIVLHHSKYTERSPIGTEVILKTFKPQTLKRFYHDWYRPNLQALIAVGDVNADSLEKVIHRQFADLKNPVQQRPRLTFPVQLTGENHFITVMDKENGGSAIQVLTKHPELKLYTRADYKKRIMRTLFNQMIRERFNELSLQANPAFINASGYIDGFTGHIDVYNSIVELKPREAEPGFKALWRENERAKQFGFTTSEIERAKKQYLSDIERAWIEKGKTSSAQYSNEYVRLFLTGEVSPGIDAEHKMAIALSNQISITDMHAFAQKMIAGKDRDIIVLTSEKDKASMPSALTLKKWIKEVENERLNPFIDETVNGDLLTDIPNRGAIIGEKNNRVLGVTELVLSNGIKVLLKPTTFKNDQIVFNAFGPGGTNVYSDGDFESANNAVDVIAGAGAGPYSGTVLNKIAIGNQVGVTPYMDEIYRGIRGSATPASLEMMFQLTHLYLTRPRKDTANFHNFITRYKASVEQSSNDPQGVFTDSVISAFHNYNTRYTPASVKKIERINLNRAYEIYKDQFGNPGDLTFIFVGSFDIGSIKPLLIKYLSSLPASTHKYKIVDLNIHPAEGNIVKKIYKGEQEKSSVSLVFSGRYNFNDENNLQLDALSEILQYKLTERLRELESGVYTPSVSVNRAKYPHADYSVFINFSCAPQNTEKLIAATLDEIGKIRTNGATISDIQKYVAEATRANENNLQENYYWFSYLTKTLKSEGDPEYILKYGEALKQLSPLSLKAAADAYLNGQNLLRFVLLPENRNKHN